MRRRKIGRKD
uniref:Uncharacterized protein n=1 Tax=Arundo donax TaxID=35708 RepID=A0A0A8ZAP0_ARUDO